MDMTLDDMSIGRSVIDLPDVSMIISDYDLSDGHELTASDDLNCLTWFVSGSYSRNTGRALEGEPRRQNWGRLGFVPARMPAVFTTGVCRLRACHLVFGDDFAASIMKTRIDWQQDRMNSFINIVSPALGGGMKRLYTEVVNKGTAWEPMVTSIASSIVIDLCRSFAMQGCQISSSGGKLAPWQVRLIEDYVREHARRGHVGSSAIAELCGISPSHLARCFRQTTGQTIRTYVEAVRIEAACKLLAETRLPLQSVAADSGFVSQSYFSTAFRRAVGITPSKYRNSRQR